MSLVILIHATTNFTGYLIGVFIEDDFLVNTSLTESYGGVMYLVAFILGSIFISAICIYFLRREFDKKAMRIDLGQNILSPD